MTKVSKQPRWIAGDAFQTDSTIQILFVGVEVNGFIEILADIKFVIHPSSLQELADDLRRQYRDVVVAFAETRFVDADEIDYLQCPSINSSDNRSFDQLTGHCGDALPRPLPLSANFGYVATDHRRHRFHHLCVVGTSR